MSASKEYLREYRKRNRQEILKYHKQWRDQNKDKMNEYYKTNFKGRSLPDIDNRKYVILQSDLKGKKYGEWLVLDEVLENTNKRRYLLVQCSCGKIKYIQKYTLLNGESTSCGHWRKRRSKAYE